MGRCLSGVKLCISGKWSSCAGQILPGTETCNGIDDDCDGVIDNGVLNACGNCGTETNNCTIGGNCYAAGDPNPANDCQYCNPAVSAIAWSNRADDTTCASDDNACTEDVCRTGLCGHVLTLDTTGPAPACYRRECNPVAGWGNVINDGAACDDGQGCTTGDTCNAGTCEGRPKSCNDFDICTDDSCDEATGQCAHAQVAATTCYTGAASTAGTGICGSGTMVCANGGWSACTGEITPGAELCDGLDNDCDGQVDEGMLPVADPARPCQQTLCMGAGGWQTAAANAGAVCRAATSICDMEEKCDGVSVDCPADAFFGSEKVCRAANGVCDAEEACSGTGTTCPTDSFKPADTKCRLANGACDVEEACSGTGAACPADSFVAAGTPCRIAGECTGPAICSGNGAACPANPALSDGTTCGDNDICNGRDVCQNGSCVAAGAPLVCNDNNACTDDSCDQNTGCKFVSATAGTSCNDGNLCTDSDSCQAGICAGQPVICEAADACSGTGVCNPKSGMCEGATSINCADGNSCTSDSCGPNGVCTHEQIPGCKQAVCKPGSMQTCGLEPCIGKKTCQSDGTWGEECVYLEGDSCDDPSGRDECAIGKGICTSEGECVYTEMQTACNMTQDGCCPDGCNATNDPDCTAECGNGIVESSEICDGALCPASCDDADACTKDLMSGSLTTCNVQCKYIDITACANGDGCCPAGCGPTTDNDCAGCGNGRIEEGEACDIAGCAENSQCNESCQCAAIEGHLPPEPPTTQQIEAELENGEAMPVAEAPKEEPEVTCFTYCDGELTDETKEINGKIREYTGWNGDLVCDPESARVIILVSYKLMGIDESADANIALLESKAEVTPWYFVQTNGAPLYEGNMRLEDDTPHPVLLYPPNLEGAKSLPALEAGLLSQIATGAPSMTIVKEGPGRMNIGPMSYEFRLSTSDTFSLTLGNGNIVAFDTPAKITGSASASAGKTVVANKIFSFVPRLPATIIGKEGQIDSKPIEERNYPVDKVLEFAKNAKAESLRTGVPISCMSFAGVEWEPSEKYQFKLGLDLTVADGNIADAQTAEAAGEGNSGATTTDVNITNLVLFGENSFGGSAGCSLVSSRSDLPAALLIAFLIAILPTGALCLVRIKYTRKK